MSDMAIQADNLVKVYRSAWRRREVRAVDGISIEVPRGATFGLLGPNGAGKTTFVKVLLSSAQPTSGRTRVFGLDSRLPEARRPIGYLPENHRFPTYFTGAGMLDLYGALSGMDARERKRRIPELLELVGLAQWGGVRLGKYSKGMLQRVGLAQALLHKPSLLVLDEPTDGVDPVGRVHIRGILQTLESQGITIFLNSHLLTEVQAFCRRVAIINLGRVALIGDVADLTRGQGYRLTAGAMPEGVQNEIARQALQAVTRNGFVDFQFATREQANLALDLLRANRVEVESLVRTTSTLEEVFVRTVNG